MRDGLLEQERGSSGQRNNHAPRGGSSSTPAPTGLHCTPGCCCCVCAAATVCAPVSIAGATLIPEIKDIKENGANKKNGSSLATKIVGTAVATYFLVDAWSKSSPLMCGVTNDSGSPIEDSQGNELEVDCSYYWTFLALPVAAITTMTAVEGAKYVGNACVAMYKNCTKKSATADDRQYDQLEKGKGDKKKQVTSAI